MKTSCFFFLSAYIAGVQGSENVAGPTDKDWQEKLRVRKGHLLEEATEEDMQHLGDHLGKNGLAFGGFFDKSSTDLIEDFKALADDQVV
jgi:hypothetical protein